MTDARAEALFQRLEPLLLDDIPDDQRPRVRAEVLRWLTAWIETYHDRSPDEQAELIAEDIPELIEEDVAGLNPQQRYEYGATAFDRWRLKALSSSTLKAAKEARADPRRREALAVEAEAAFQELRTIEDRLHREFPATAENCARMLGESKLDALYVARGGKVLSRRAGRRLR
jgi:hypothetical protein